VALAPDEIKWLEAQAQMRSSSVSATVSETIRFSMRDAAWKRCFEAVGGEPQLSDEEREQIDTEFRELGLIS
jgi:hypothetical protein